MDDNIATFNAITGASPDVARSFLEMTAGNFERAIELFYENPDLASGVGAGLSANAAPIVNPTPATRPSFGTQDSDGVIHIDSDDDEDMQFDDDTDNDADEGRAVAAQAAALAQEEEDMAMAKRLQEELYQENHGAGAGSGSGSAMDDVRAPIARTTETLVAPGPSWGGGEEDMEAALLEQLRRRQQQQRKPTKTSHPQEFF